MSYGNLSNIFLYVNYGFTTPNNPFNKLPIFFSMQNRIHQLISQEFKFKQELCQINNLNLENLSFELYQDKFDLQNLKLLKILMIPSFEINWIGKENLLKADFSKPLFSWEFEQAVLD